MLFEFVEDEEANYHKNEKDFDYILWSELIYSSKSGLSFAHYCILWKMYTEEA